MSGSAGGVPAEFDLTRTVSAQALVSFRGNHYSVPPGLGGAQVQVRHRLGAEDLRIVTSRGATVALHRRAPDGAGQLVRDEGHVIALEKAVLGAFSTARPCTHKTRRPPSAAALAEAARLRGSATEYGTTGPAAHVVIDLSAYVATAGGGDVRRFQPARRVAGRVAQCRFAAPPADVELRELSWLAADYPADDWSPTDDGRTGDRPVAVRAVAKPVAQPW